MPRLYTNNYVDLLNGAITNVATSINVIDASGLPSVGSGDTCLLTIDDGTNVEIVEVTSVTGNTLTVVRGREGTSGTAFATSTAIELRATATSLANSTELGDEILADSPLGYWKCTEASGTLADSSATGS